VGYNARVPFTRAGHHFVSAPASINHCAGIAIVTVQTPVTFTTCYPYDHVISAIRRGNKSRPQTGLTHGPRTNYRWRIGGSNFVSRDGIIFGVKNEIRSLAGSVGGS
jgi:hypothetical protein